MFGGAKGEVAHAVEDEPRDAEGFGGSHRPWVEHVGDETTGVEVAEEALERVTEEGRGLEELGKEFGAWDLVEADDVFREEGVFGREIEGFEADFMAGRVGAFDGRGERRGGWMRTLLLMSLYKSLYFSSQKRQSLDV
ncbi:NIFU-like protein 2 [Striga asiatica]|uniref:NIFU-like protein 2 n=1 Tax=Striga asiatica TaxID=4170 RepID=A0A5A7RHC4_STRAF|nr:NIFU-like protein 2 [Striga asiatica]